MQYGPYGLVHTVNLAHGWRIEALRWESQFETTRLATLSRCMSSLQVDCSAQWPDEIPRERKSLALYFEPQCSEHSSLPDKTHLAFHERFALHIFAEGEGDWALKFCCCYLSGVVFGIFAIDLGSLLLVRLNKRLSERELLGSCLPGRARAAEFVILQSVRLIRSEELPWSERDSCRF